VIAASATLSLFGCKEKGYEQSLSPLENRLYSWHVERLDRVQVSVNAQTSILDIVNQLNSKLEELDGVTQVQISAFPNLVSVGHQLDFLAQPISWSVPVAQFETFFLGDHSGFEILERLDKLGPDQVFFNSIVNDEGAVVLVNHSTHFPSGSIENENAQSE